MCKEKVTSCSQCLSRQYVSSSPSVSWASTLTGSKRVVSHALSPLRRLTLKRRDPQVSLYSALYQLCLLQFTRHILAVYSPLLISGVLSITCLLILVDHCCLCVASVDDDLLQLWLYYASEIQSACRNVVIPLVYDCLCNLSILLFIVLTLETVLHLSMWDMTVFSERNLCSLLALPH